ncbi:MAG TPA: hypothetical protein VG755_25840 [Nannocystaceae bacterium]|nr:hypothetical protein [Nannocystaceae bacterium]
MAASTIVLAGLALAGVNARDLALPTTSPTFQPRVSVDDPSAGGLFHEPGVLFINFDGGQMMDCNGSDWPVMNCSTIMHDLVEPYSGDTATRAAVVQAMSNDVADFALTVVGERPPDDTLYDMVMVGNWTPAPEGGFAGVAPTIDCWNTNKAETSFSLDLGDASSVAKVVGQEAAHVWGLEHVDSQSDILFPTVGGASDPAFEDECHHIVVIDGGIVESTANCPEMHAANCDEPDTQNSYRDLLMIFGPPGADVTAPTVEILVPMANEAFASGASFDLTLRMIDDVPPQLFDIYASIDADEQGAMLGAAQWGPELVTPVSGLPDGEHFIRIDIADQQGNPATATVHFTIGIAPVDTTGEGSGSDDGTGGGTTSVDTTSASATTASTEATSDGTSESGAASHDDTSGCGCTTHARPLPLLVTLAPLIRRRRNAAISRVRPV